MPDMQMPGIFFEAEEQLPGPASTATGATASIAVAAKAVAAAESTLSPAAATAATKATRAMTAAEAFLTRSGFVNLEGAALEGFAVHIIDRRSAFLVIRHFNESKST